jgi:hypothetical protein
MHNLKYTQTSLGTKLKINYISEYANKKKLNTTYVISFLTAFILALGATVAQ